MYNLHAADTDLQVKSMIPNRAQIHQILQHCAVSEAVSPKTNETKFVVIVPVNFISSFGFSVVTTAQRELTTSE